LQHRLSGLDECGEVHHGVEASRPENMIDALLVAGVRLHKLCFRRNRLPPAFAQIVQYGHRVSDTQETVGHYASDVSSTASNQNAHRLRLLKSRTTNAASIVMPQRFSPRLCLLYTSPSPR